MTYFKLTVTHEHVSSQREVLVPGTIEEVLEIFRNDVLSLHAEGRFKVIGVNIQLHEVGA